MQDLFKENLKKINFRVTMSCAVAEKSNLRDLKEQENIESQKVYVKEYKKNLAAMEEDRNYFDL